MNGTLFGGNQKTGYNLGHAPQPRIQSPWGDGTPAKFAAWLLINHKLFDSIDNTEDLYRALRWAYIEGAVDSAELSQERAENADFTPP